MENKQLQEEAEEYCKLVPEVITKKMTLDECIAIVNEFVINSKYVEQEKLKFAIEQLNVLNTNLQAKCETLKEMASSYIKKDVQNFENHNFFMRKIEGVRLTKEEIRRNLKDLEQKLKELEK